LRKVYQHIILWVGIYIVYTYMSSFYDDLQELMVVNLVNVPLFMVAYYLLKHYQIPHLYNKGKMGWFIVSFGISSFVISAICRINGILWMDAFHGRSSEEIPFMTMGAYLVKTARYYSPAMAILAWESHQARKKETEKILQLEKEKLATELKYLKAQINPHFLFNTLNNLYYFVVNNSPKAPDMVMRLSNMLDYILYKSQKDRVPLKDELDTITHFIELEKVRYGERLEVSFMNQGDQTYPVSPLLLLSIVENAFKHGASGDIHNPCIRINIEAKNNAIKANVWNTKSNKLGELNDSYKVGIGLDNLRKQLNLIYRDHHQLSIEDNEHSFRVSLVINTAA